MEKVSPPVRIFAILLVLLGLAGMLALRTMGPSVESEASVAPVPHVAKPVQKKAAKAAPTKAAKASPAKAPASAPALNSPTAPPSGFPLAVDAALRKHRILVVSLVVPGARVDALAAAEAQAGAKLSGAGYLALNVLNEGVARALLAKLDALQDPSVLVLTRSGEVALELSGFVDRETVAQAAANASA